MLIREFEERDNDRLIALVAFLKGRMEDTDSEASISVDSFIKLARSMGVHITDGMLRDMANKPPLSNIITSIDKDRVRIGGTDNPAEPEQMDTDQAQDHLDKLAKRAAAKGLK